MFPKPPALETAAASSGPAAPASAEVLSGSVEVFLGFSSVSSCFTVLYSALYPFSGGLPLK